MQRFGALVLAVLLSTLGFAGCGKGQQGKKLVDGVYRAEFKDYDSYGYRDYVQVTVEDGTVVKVEYDGTNTEGNLKTKDEKYQKDMEKTQDTNPTRYTSDLTNQLMEKGSIDQVDDVAGATWSSECFRTLYRALLENSMVSGDTATLTVENVPEK